MPTLRTTPTVDKAANAWTRGFAAAVRDAAGDSGRLTPHKAEEMTGPYADNARNYFDHTGKHWANADTVIDSGARYVRANLSTAAGKDGKVSLADIRKLPADLVDDLLILRGRAPTGAGAGAALQKLKDAVKGTEIPDINDYGKYIEVSTYPKSKSRADILRDIVGYDDLTDKEVSDWFDSTRGSAAIADFAGTLRDVGSEERDNADDPDVGKDIEKRLGNVATAAERAFAPASQYKSLEVLDHGIEEDGDTEHHLLLAHQKDDTWLVLHYSDFPF